MKIHKSTNLDLSAWLIKFSEINGLPTNVFIIASRGINKSISFDLKLFYNVFFHQIHDNFKIVYFIFYLKIILPSVRRPINCLY